MSFDGFAMALKGALTSAISSFDEGADPDDAPFYVGTRCEETKQVLRDFAPWREVFPGCSNADLDVYDAKNFSLVKQGYRFIKVSDFSPTDDGVQFSVVVGRAECPYCSYSVEWSCRERSCSGSYLRREVSNFKVWRRFSGSKWRKEVKQNMIDLLKTDEDNAPIVYTPPLTPKAVKFPEEP